MLHLPQECEMVLETSVMVRETVLVAMTTLVVEEVGRGGFGGSQGGGDYGGSGDT